MTSKIDDSRMQRVGGPVDRCSEGQLFHKKVDPGVHFKAVKVVGVSLQPHKQTSIRHIGRTESISTSYNYFFFCHRHICHIFMRMSCFLLYILNNFIWLNVTITHSCCTTSLLTDVSLLQLMFHRLQSCTPFHTSHTQTVLPYKIKCNSEYKLQKHGVAHWH